MLVECGIGDFRNLIKTLASKDENFPVFQKLEKDIRFFIKNWKGEDIPLEIRAKIVNNLNKMLLDRWLFYDLMDYFANKGITAGEGEWSAPIVFILSPILYLLEDIGFVKWLFVNLDANPVLYLLEDIRFVKWLFVNLDANGVFDKKEKALTAINKEQLCKLNKILLCDILGTHRIEYLRGEFAHPFYVKKNSVISTMKRAGYQFVREYNFLTQCYFLEFKRRF